MGANVYGFSFTDPNLFGLLLDCFCFCCLIGLNIRIAIGSLQNHHFLGLQQHPNLGPWDALEKRA